MLLFLTISPLLLSVMMIGTAPVAAETISGNYWDKFTVLSSNFKPELYTPPDISKCVRVEKQSPVIDNFQTLDSRLLSKTETTETYEFRSKVTFKWQVAFFTTATIDQVYQGRYNTNYNVNWLVLRTKAAETGGWTNTHGAAGEHYSVDISTYQLGTMTTKGYNNYLSFDMKMNDPTPSSIELGGNTILHPTSFVATLEESVFTSCKTGDVKSTNNEPGVVFTPGINVGVSSIALDKAVPSVDTKDDNLNSQTILDQKISDLGLGVVGGAVETVNTEQNTQVGKAVPMQGRLINDRTFWLELRPDVARNKQIVTHTNASIDIDNVNNWASPPRILNTPNAVDFETERTLGATITNKYIFVTISTTFILLSTCTLDVQQTTTPIDLSEPHIDINTNYWDNYVTGATNVTITEKSDWLMILIDNIMAWWGQYGWMIITGLIVAAAIGGFIYSIGGGQLGKSAGAAIKKKLADQKKNNTKQTKQKPRR